MRRCGYSKHRGDLRVFAAIMVGLTILMLGGGLVLA